MFLGWKCPAAKHLVQSNVFIAQQTDTPHSTENLGHTRWRGMNDSECLHAQNSMIPADSDRTRTRKV